jgi:hypothetical protein
MSIYLSLWTIARICIVCFFAGIAWALINDDDCPQYEMRGEHEQRRAA